MKIKFTCSTCSKTSTRPGALLFSPPNKDGECMKFHICTACYKDMDKTYGLINYQPYEQAKG